MLKYWTIQFWDSLSGWISAVHPCYFFMACYFENLILLVQNPHDNIFIDFWIIYTLIFLWCDVLKIGLKSLRERFLVFLSFLSHFISLLLYFEDMIKMFRRTFQNVNVKVLNIFRIILVACPSPHKPHIHCYSTMPNQENLTQTANKHERWSTSHKALLFVWGHWKFELRLGLTRNVISAPWTVNAPLFPLNSIFAKFKVRFVTMKEVNAYFLLLSWNC